jgi:hypothetical protein
MSSEVRLNPLSQIERVICPCLEVLTSFAWDKTIKLTALALSRFVPSTPEPSLASHEVKQLSPREALFQIVKEEDGSFTLWRVTGQAPDARVEKIGDLEVPQYLGGKTLAELYEQQQVSKKEN